MRERKRERGRRQAAKVTEENRKWGHCSFMICIFPIHGPRTPELLYNLTWGFCDVATLNKSNLPPWELKRDYRSRGRNLLLMKHT